MNVPELRFPEFEGEWEEKQFKSICSIQMGQSPSSKNYTENSDDTVLIQGNADLSSGKVSPRLYTTEITKTSNPGDIIMTVRAPVGDLAFNNYFACIGRGVCAIKGDKFIYYLLEHLKENRVWDKISQGSTFEAVSSSDINNLKIQIPSISEQRKIAAFLSKVDEKIEKLEKKEELWHTYKKGMMQQLFSQKLRFKDEDGNDYPDWEENDLDYFVSIPKKEKLLNVEKKVLITVKLHCKGIEVNENVKPKITSKGRPYYQRNAGEILIGRQNFHNGGIGIVPKELDGSICSNAITSLAIDNSKIIDNFLLYYLSREEYYKRAEVVMGGTGQKEISEKNLLKLKLETPTLPEQTKLANFLTSIDVKIKNIRKELQINKEFKKGLLQQMFPIDKKSKDIKTKDLSKLDKQTEQTALL